jgi:hypothetical protein
VLMFTDFCGSTLVVDCGAACGVSSLLERQRRKH